MIRGHHRGHRTIQFLLQPLLFTRQGCFEKQMMHAHSLNNQAVMQVNLPRRKAAYSNVIDEGVCNADHSRVDEMLTCYFYSVCAVPRGYQRIVDLYNCVHFAQLQETNCDCCHSISSAPLTEVYYYVVYKPQQAHLDHLSCDDAYT